MFKVINNGSNRLDIDMSAALLKVKGFFINLSELTWLNCYLTLHIFYHEP